jgi:hypothetical protein
MNLIRSILMSLILSTASSGLWPDSARSAEDGNWTSVLTTTKGGPRCAKEYNVPFQISDGILSAQTKADGLAWIIKGTVKENGDVRGRGTGVVIGAPVQRFFVTLKGKLGAQSGSGTWKTTAGCSGTIAIAKTG